MRSIDGLTLQQVQFAGFVKPFAAQTRDNDLSTNDPQLPEGAPPVILPEGLADRPGLPIRGYLNVYPSVGRPAPHEETLLGSFRNVRWGLQRAFRGSRTTPQTQAFVNPVPGGWPMPPAWAVPVSPDAELRYGSPSHGNY